MAEYVDLVVGYKKRLQKGCNDEKTMAILHKLKKIPISVEILQETGIGKIVHNMTNNGGETGAMAQNIYKVWKKAVVRDSSHSKSKELKHTKMQSDVNKSHKESKSKDVFMENHKGCHNEKVTASNNHNKTLQQHQNRSKIDLKNKHKTSDSHTKSIPEYSSYNDFHDADNESENEIITTDYLIQKKTMNHIESSTKLSSHKDKDISKKCKSNRDKSYKHSRQPQKKELSSQPDSSKQKSRTKSSTSKLLSSNNESFNSSNASFEDILGLNDTVNPKKKKPQNNLLSNKINSLDAVKRESTKKSQGVKREASRAFARTVDDDEENEYTLEFKKPKPLQLDVDVDITLPAIQPYYKPLPHKDIDGILKKKKTTMSNEEAIMFTTPRRDRTAVYAGKRSIIRNIDVPSLYDQCVRVLIDNVDGLGYTGGVPYHILKPILQTCSSSQLYRLESCNPELLEDTDELWKIHCERDFKTHNPGEHETWRDLFLRLHDERERKLRQLKANISASTLVKTGNIRSTKLAYVDSVAKPPRDVARRQAKHGTGLPSALPQKAGPSSKSAPRATAPFINASNSSVQPSFAPVPPKKAKPAPLMQKTLKLFRQHLRR